MSLIEFIGFVISMAALIFLFFKRVSEDRYRRKNPEKFAEEKLEQEKALKELMKSMHIGTEEEGPPPPPPRAMALQSPLKKVVVSTVHPKKLEKYSEKAAKEKENYEKRMLSKTYHKKTENAPVYEVHRLTYNSRGNDLIQALPSRRDMLIYKELFGKPLALRNPMDDSL